MTRTKKPHDRNPKGTPARTAPSSEAALQHQIEERLSAVEPDVEVLAAELAGSRRSPRLRVFLDRPGGVDLELCARVTHHLRDLLVDYEVEVSSPGPERPLTKLHHYQRHLGHRVRVRTGEPIDGRSDFKGELVGADPEGVSLAADWGMVRIPHERIRRSNLISQPEGSRRPS
ncbi:MAG: ribosome maturation factor RimP [Solirubrobacterales bacterium]